MRAKLTLAVCWQFPFRNEHKVNIVIANDVEELGRSAAEHGAEQIRAAISARGEANIVVATGASQFTVLAALMKSPEIDWPKVTGFHLDEYIGLPLSHPASFRKYLRERFVDLVPIGKFYYIDGEAADPLAECRRLGDLIASRTIDMAFIGIGENGHLAFNDPPADFKTETPFLVVHLDEACRRQQFGEGWFPTMDAVPRRAISMSVRQILKSQCIVCSVPDERKAVAVRGAIEGPLTPDCPASILQQHPDATVFLDPPAASLLKNLRPKSNATAEMR
jgi:glucosamine-6-phosphate deaminase